MSNSDQPRNPYMVTGWGREGWINGIPESDPFVGNTGFNPWPGIYSSYGEEVGPTGKSSLFASAGMAHVNAADADTAGGRWYGMPPDTGQPIITPTSRIFAKPPPFSQPSHFFSGTQYPVEWGGDN